MKRIKILISMITITLLLGSIVTVLIGNEGNVIADRNAFDDNLVACWHFDEGNGTTVYDSSGNGNHGTISGATWMTGVCGDALSFDGVSNHVNFSSSVLNTAPYTFCAWLKPDSITDGQYHPDIQNGAQTYSSYGISMGLHNDGNYRFHVK